MMHVSIMPVMRLAGGCGGVPVVAAAPVALGAVVAGVVPVAVALTIESVAVFAKVFMMLMKLVRTR